MRIRLRLLSRIKTLLFVSILINSLNICEANAQVIVNLKDHTAKGQGINITRKKVARIDRVWDTTFSSFKPLELADNVAIGFSTINCPADFSQIVFDRYVAFWKDTIKYPVNFWLDSFKMQTNFQGSTFDSAVDFSGATFAGGAYFILTKFRATVDFRKTSFKEIAWFGGADFSKAANFQGAEFDTVVSFFNMRFGRSVNLEKLVLSPKSVILFENSLLADTIDLSFNPTLFNEIDLASANFSDPSKYDKKNNYAAHQVLLYKTDISKLRLDYIHFKLLLPDSIDNPYIEISGKRLPISFEEKESIYEALLNNFKSHGQNDSYELLDIEYRHFKSYQHWWTIPIYWINRWWWGFGYQKERVFAWTLFFTLLFTFINVFCLDYLNNEVYTLSNIPLVTWNSRVRRIGRRFWFSFIYSSTIFFKLTLNIEKINFQRKAGTIYLIFMYTLGVICLAYMANFVLQK